MTQRIFCILHSLLSVLTVFFCFYRSAQSKQCLKFSLCAGKYSWLVAYHNPWLHLLLGSRALNWISGRAQNKFLFLHSESSKVLLSVHTTFIYVDTQTLCVLLVLFVVHYVLEFLSTMTEYLVTCWTCIHSSTIIF